MAGMISIEELMRQGMEHHRNNRMNEAEAAFRQVLTRQPNHADALYYLGAVYFARKDNKGATDLIMRAIQINPNEPLYHGNIGVLFATQGHMEDAIKAMKRCVQLMPNYPDGYLNLGSALFQTGKLDEAIIAYKKALEQNPRHFDAANGLARIYKKQNNMEECIAAYKLCTEIRPQAPENWLNLGWALGRVQRFDDAAEAYRKATELKPDYSDGFSGLSYSLQNAGRLDEAIVAASKAVELEPHRPVLHGNLGMLLLLKGNFEEGWPEYEWRCQTREWSRDPARERFNHPRWDGSELGGKRILLHPEQGFGDTIHFVRYASLIAQRGGKVIVECYPPLDRLLKTVPGVEQVVVCGTPLPEFDVQSSMMTLPLIFNTRLETIPANIPYISAAPEDVEKWRARFAQAQKKGLKVGLAWAGQPKHENDKERSIPLMDLAPLASAPGVHFYSLQKEFGGDQAQNPPPGMRLIDWTEDIHDFADTAAMMMSLDLIITVDTAIAHLAGALGRPTWVMVPSSPDWRWMTGRSDTPWYPTLRLFRKPGLRQWAPTVQQISRELVELAKSKV
jgi:Flp pilus assembly protein TadD